MASFVPEDGECGVQVGHFQLALDDMDGGRFSALCYVHGEPKMYHAVSACSFAVAAPAAPNILAAYVPYCQPATGGGYAVDGVSDDGVVFDSFECVVEVPPTHGGSPETLTVTSSHANDASDASDEHGMQQRTALDVHLLPARTFADIIGGVGACARRVCIPSSNCLMAGGNTVGADGCCDFD